MALIAYRQPITRGEIEEVRGVSVSSNIIKTLLERDWIKVLGHKDVPGKPTLYGTTREFLDYFNLKTLDQLPTLAEIKDLDSIHPELELDEDSNEKSSDEMPDDSDDNTEARLSEEAGDAAADAPADDADEASTGADAVEEQMSEEEFVEETAEEAAEDEAEMAETETVRSAFNV
jgi:segregation and condensation protein B